jgi:hypothetical protein
MPTSTHTASPDASGGGAPQRSTTPAAPSAKPRPTPIAASSSTSPAVRFGDYARDWIEHYPGRTSRGFRESTRSMYRQMLNARVIPYFDGVRRLRLSEIQPRDVKAFVRWMVERRDPRTGRLLSKSNVRQHVAVLRALLGDAKEEGIIRDNPAAGVRVIVPEGDGTGRRQPLESAH